MSEASSESKKRRATKHSVHGRKKHPPSEDLSLNEVSSVVDAENSRKKRRHTRRSVATKEKHRGSDEKSEEELPSFIAEPKSADNRSKSIAADKNEDASRKHRHRSRSRRYESHEKRKSTRYADSDHRDIAEADSNEEPDEEREHRSHRRRHRPVHRPVERTASEQSMHRRKVLICIGISLGIGLVVGAVVGYGIYQWVTSVQTGYFETNLNVDGKLDRFHFPTTTFAMAETISVKKLSEKEYSNLDSKVGINVIGCGKLGKSVGNPFETNSNNQKLGFGEKSGRIVGGTTTAIEHHPWQVSLWTDAHTCGGTLIASNWVLFAAHCAVPYPKPQNWTVFVGESDRRNMPVDGQSAKVSDLIVHESFNEDTFDNDIALIRLQKYLTLNDKVQTVCLPSSLRKVIPNTICYISGWGAHAENDERLPYRLTFTPVTIMDKEICNSDEWLMGMVTANMFCAGSEDGSVDACQGDSGGPLTCYDSVEEASYLMGAVSWGIGCGAPRMPGVYTYLPRYLEWIRDAMTRVEGRYFPTQGVV